MRRGERRDMKGGDKREKEGGMRDKICVCHKITSIFIIEFFLKVPVVLIKKHKPFTMFVTNLFLL